VLDVLGVDGVEGGSVAEVEVLIEVGYRSVAASVG
jgi:hypothetical protein